MGFVNGMLAALGNPDHWIESGTATIEETTQAFLAIFEESFGECESSVSIPIGGIIPFAGETIPDGFLECDGSMVGSWEYPELFAVIDPIFKFEVSGIWYIQLPDLGGRMSVGQGAHGSYPIGQTGGAEEHTLTIAEMPEHTHSYNWAYHSSIPTGPAVGYQYATSGPEPTTATGGGDAHNNMPPYLALRQIIRYE